MDAKDGIIRVKTTGLPTEKQKEELILFSCDGALAVARAFSHYIFSSTGSTSRITQTHRHAPYTNHLAFSAKRCKQSNIVYDDVPFNLVVQMLKSLRTVRYKVNNPQWCDRIGFL